MTLPPNAILQTLRYHARFSYALTLPELHRLLITSQPVTRTELKKNLTNLVKKGKVQKEEKYYFLPNFPCLPDSPNSPPSLRLQRKIASNQKLQIAQRAVQLFARLPWVRLVCVTGALAMENSGPDDDIDLMIVTQKNRLWLTRPLVVLFTLLFFKRRKPITDYGLPIPDYRNALCLNLWLDQASLLMPPDRRTLRVAHELAQMKPLADKENTYEKMSELNQWGSKFLANTWESEKLKAKKPYQLFTLRCSSSLYKIIGQLNPLNLVNYCLYQLQRLYMRPRRTTEHVTLHSAFFHPLPRRAPSKSSS